VLVLQNRWHICNSNILPLDPFPSSWNSYQQMPTFDRLTVCQLLAVHNGVVSKLLSAVLLQALRRAKFQQQRRAAVSVLHTEWQSADLLIVKAAIQRQRPPVNSTQQPNVYVCHDYTNTLCMAQWYTTERTAQNTSNHYWM